MAVLALTGAKRLRDERVQPNQQSCSKHGEDVDQNSTKAHGSDGHRAVRKAAHHHGVYDGHAHPADFGEDERQGQSQRRSKLGAECFVASHWRKRSGKSLSGLIERSKRA